MRLGVNVDHVATVRQARGGKEPDPVRAALICQKAGADAVVMHLREDRRHIQDDDVVRARRRLSIKFNLEMSIAESVLKTALRLRPEQATLVPERRQERTTEGGLDLYGKSPALRRAIDRLSARRIGVSLFIDPDRRQVERAAEWGVPAIELHTGDYANAEGAPGRRLELGRLRAAAVLAQRLGLRVYAGHGLDYANVRPVAGLPGMEELNIGYSIVSRALWTGFERAVRDMRAAIGKKR